MIKLEELLLDAIAELEQAEASAARGVERQWVQLVKVKVDSALTIAKIRGIVPDEVVPVPAAQAK